ncbi:hypothetical protein OG871_26340 [Kitasatospora sp. NBC_00374]|uniref:hypothetical protein n=1 Tax=Kitasatospora sp. NBC_00374 TaxID=2975964 RepID=UPI00324B24E7
MQVSRVLAASAASFLTFCLGAGTAAAAPTGGLPDRPCHSGRTGVLLPTTWTGLDQAKLVRGGAPVETTLTIRNTSGHTVRNLDSLVFIQPSVDEGDAVLLESKTAGGDWTPVPWDVVHLNFHYTPGKYQLAKDETLTLKFRASAKRDATAVDYTFSWNAKSDVLDDDTDRFITIDDLVNGTAVPGGKGTCTEYYSQVGQSFSVVEAPAPTPTPTPTPAPTPTPTPTAAPTAAPTATPTTPAATLAARAVPALAETELAETGGGAGARPLAVTGAAAVTLGAGILVALRRRNGSHG